MTILFNNNSESKYINKLLRNYIKNIRKQSESKWSVKKRTGEKVRKYMGKMRIGWEKV